MLEVHSECVLYRPTRKTSCGHELAEEYSVWLPKTNDSYRYHGPFPELNIKRYDEVIADYFT